MWLKEFSLCFFITSNLFFRSILCNSCTEDNEVSVSCNNFDDLLRYPNPEKRKIIHVTSPEVGSDKSSVREMFMCGGSTFEQYKKVKHFDMFNTGVLSIDSNCFKGMNDLVTVNLSKNNLTSIDMKVFKASEDMLIRGINLESNEILDIDLKAVVLLKLDTLNLSNNRLTSIYVRTEELPKIVHLNLQNNDIWRFGIISETLVSLDLSNNCIKTFGKAQMILPSLKNLHLNGNHLTTINEDMLGNMPNLRSIYLAQNLIHTVLVPKLNLLYIDLNYNMIKSTENLEAKFVNHSTLHLSFNKVFEMIPRSSFGKLTEFVCIFCNIHSIDPYYVHDTAPELESLSLRSNLLKSAKLFESRSGDLKLISVDLTYNQIKRINIRTFSRLSNVINLFLANNEIQTIAPGAFNRMTMLHTLDLSNNFVYQLPPNLFDQIPIVWLLLNGNNMAYFPIPGWNTETNEIADNNSMLNNLQTLNLENNPFQCDCLEQIHTWAQRRSFNLKVYDSKVKAGEKPACIINDEGCKVDVGKDFVKDYWHLFNDNKFQEILLQDEDI
uniref:Putative insulin-like growth factor-binding protein complex acid labile subunit n=1 Tax=Phlebotomus kandelakii TaxID=1109342 RepID=A0A6B2EC59_9DIPT